jgi:HEAT repeat protein
MENMKKFTLILALGIAVGAAQAQQIPPKGFDQNKPIEVLKSNAGFKEKHEACRDIALRGTAEAIPALAPLLTDEKLSHMARYALEQIGGNEAKTALRNALGQAKGMPLIGVISSVGTLRDTQAIPALTALLNGADTEVSDAAAHALGRIGGIQSSKSLLAALGKATPATYDGLLRVAESLPPNEAASVYDAVRKTNASQWIRMAALRGALIARGDGAAPLLIESLRGGDFAFVIAAAGAARELPASATKALASELPQLDVERQLLVVQALGDRRDRAATPQLLAIAKNGDAKLRPATAKSLVQIGDAAAVSQLIEWATASEEEVSKTARGGLVRFPARDVEAPLLAMLKTPDAKVRVAAADIITQRRMTSAIPQLLALATDADRGVANAALGAIGNIGSTGEIPTLLKILTSGASTPQVEAAMTAIFQRQRDAAATDALIAALPAAPQPIKISLIRLLRRAGGPKALAEVRAAVGNADPQIKEIAARNLIDWQTADAIPDLLEIAKNPPLPSLKVLSLQGILRLVPLQEGTDEQKLASVKAALAMIERPDEKRLALTALGGIPTTDALALVVPSLDDPALKAEAAIAALTIGEKLAATQPAVVSDAMKKLIQAAPDAKLVKRAQALVK